MPIVFRYCVVRRQEIDILCVFINLEVLLIEQIVAQTKQSNKQNFVSDAIQNLIPRRQIRLFPKKVSHH